MEVEFDDGDSGRITIDQLRMIPQDFPVVGKNWTDNIYWLKCVYIIYIFLILFVK